MQANNKKDSGLKLAHMVVKTLKDKCLRGTSSGWDDFQNGFGDDVGKDIDAVIRLAERIIKSSK